MLVTAINRTGDLLLVGDRYLFPHEGRRVTLRDYEQARAQYGAGLTSPDAPDPDLLDLEEEEPEEYSLDVLDGDADEADLEQMTRAELVEAARLRGIVPGRMTKRELIEAIHDNAD